MLDFVDRVKAIVTTSKAANTNNNKGNSYLPADKLEPPTTGPAPDLDQPLVPRRPLSVIMEEDVLPDTDVRQPGEGQELDLTDRRDHVVGVDVHNEPGRHSPANSLPLDVLIQPPYHLSATAPPLPSPPAVPSLAAPDDHNNIVQVVDNGDNDQADNNGGNDQRALSRTSSVSSLDDRRVRFAGLTPFSTPVGERSLSARSSPSPSRASSTTVGSWDSAVSTLSTAASALYNYGPRVSADLAAGYRALTNIREVRNLI